LGGEREAFGALLGRVRIGEVDKAHAAGGDRAHAVAEFHARPLLHVLAAVGVLGEVDPGDRAHAPLRVGEAAGIAVHDRVVGHAAGERIVLGFVRSLGAGALLGFVGAATRLLALAPGGGRGGAHGALGDPAPARALGQALELVGRLVDRLQVTLVLELASGGRDVRVPALGHAPARELNVALVERRLQLQEQQVLSYVEDCRRHDPTTLASSTRSYP